MTPKRGRSTSIRSKKVTKYQDAVDDADESGFNKEISNYRKQIRDLKKEIVDYKKKVVAMQAEIDVLKVHSIINPIKLPLIEKNQLDLRSVKSPSSEIKHKGCNCKGNCSNKICGCVKKNISCQKFCRCNDVQCQNQDIEKESAYAEEAILSKDDEQALEKLESLSLNQEALYASKKKSKRSVFNSSAENNDISNKENIHTANSKVIETKRRLFTQNSKELVDIDTDQDTMSTVKSDYMETNANDLSDPQSEASHTPISKRTRNLRGNKKDLNIYDDNNIQKKEYKSIFEPRDELPEDAMIENNKKSQVSETAVMVNNVTSSGNTIGLSKKRNKHTKSTSILKKKSKSMSPDAYKIGTDTKVKSKSISPIKIFIDVKMNKKQLPISNHLHSSQFPENQVEPVLYFKSDEEMTENIRISSPGNLDEENLQRNSNENKNLNPMVPKRELQRSPINATGDLVVPVLNKRFSSPKKELAVAEVDWEQHQSELILCQICKRKFFPHRIDKHLTFCKGI